MYLTARAPCNLNLPLSLALFKFHGFSREVVILRANTSTQFYTNKIVSNVHVPALAND